MSGAGIADVPKLDLASIRRMKSTDLDALADLVDDLAEIFRVLAHLSRIREQRTEYLKGRRDLFDSLAGALAAGRLVDVAGQPADLVDLVMRRERQRIRQTEADRRARRALAMMKNGKTNAEIAAAIGVKHPKSVSRIVREYRQRVDRQIGATPAADTIQKPSNNQQG